jgi:hypothetical protein
MNNLMKYLKYRPNMQNGDIIAFQGKDYGARLIQWGTKSRFSHVGLVVRIKEVSIDRVFIAESVTKTGVVLLPLSRKLENYPGKAWWSPLALSSSNDDKNAGNILERTRNFIYKWAMSELGKSYDFKLIGSIVKNILFNKILPQATKEQYICSEYIATAFNEAHLLPEGISTNLTPEQIIKLPILGEPIDIL